MGGENATERNEMKAPGALFNTHIKSVKGLFTIDGEKTEIHKGQIDIRCTSDSHGETLSLTYRNLQMTVKVKDVEKLIEETRKDRKDVA